MSVLRPRAACALAAAVSALAAAPARADVGDTIDALPGIARVPVVAPSDRTGVALAGSTGYGWTEGVLHDGDSHHRAFGSLAASVQPAPFLVAGLRLDGRYDWSSGPQSTSGWVGDPRLEVRAGVPVGKAFRLGGQLGIWFPGNDAPSWIAGATTPDASFLASWHPPDSPITLASRLGFRLDNSAKSAPDADRLAPSDRLSLGLNDASAVLAGLGISAAAAPRLEILADATWDLLVGTGSPGALKSPIILSAGVRYALDREGFWELEVVGAASPSERPEVAVGVPLVDIEPRISGFVGLMARPWASKPARLSAPPPVAPSPVAPPQPASVPERAKLRGHIASEEGQAPVAAAHLVIRSGSGAPRESRSDEQGHFEVDDLDVGPASVEVTADGFTPATRTITLSASTPDLDVSVAKALPSGQVRGLVRDFGGKPVV